MTMTFGEKLKVLRKGKRLTQTQLANVMGLSLRTIQNYEKGISYPKQTEIYARMAAFFDVSAEYLISGANYEFPDFEKRKPTSQDIQNLVAEVGGLFADSDISDEDKDTIIQAITDLYWRAKAKGRKLTSRNKFLPDEEEESADIPEFNLM